MGVRFILDTNAVIDFLGNRLPESASVFLENIEPIISVITRIEVLGWYRATDEQIEHLKSYLNEVDIMPLEEAIILKTIELRQTHRIKTPDAIIAATALVNKYTLISRNLSDFSSISGLTVIDPYTL
jgi:predicted nucleic acid-binding protein